MPDTSSDVLASNVTAVTVVKDGVVTLEWTVARLWERMEAERALRGIEGGKG